MGIPPATLATWVESHKKEGLEAFPGNGHLKSEGAPVPCTNVPGSLISYKRPSHASAGQVSPGFNSG